MDNLKRASRIAIVGVGQVGAAAAYALVLGSIADELLLVDTRAAWRDGQVRDLSDAAYASRSKTRVYSATYREASQCDIVVITAGSKYLYGQTSMDYLYRNTSIVRSIINEMKPFRSDTVLLIVANPVDLMTSLAKELSNLPSAQVLGSGTFLDSIRLRGLLADETGVNKNWLLLPLHPRRLGSGCLVVRRSRRSAPEGCTGAGEAGRGEPRRGVQAPLAEHCPCQRSDDVWNRVDRV
ncbi:hypothetical protein AN5842.2 [Aspergillus nidulans FGSC A4]|nr:hypothetical protein AN5842.2 [Aspergillus nidulans FGSC A4]|eukprot:XP_663446.1 hypothetical protein AN5842.2 [Aspergillus nidulans FGSC A4]